MHELTTKPRRRIYLMRHGSVTYFDETGRPVLPEQVPLNADGRAQADAAGAAFAAEGVVFDKVIVSGLPRTIETAARVLAAAQLEHTVEIWPDFRATSYMRHSPACFRVPCPRQHGSSVANRSANCSTACIRR
jgi:broad specificity phosphatase PhoE